MKFYEFGKENEKTIILLHGMMQKWETIYETLKELEKDYRLIIPVMSGYYENSPNFISFVDECSKIEKYVIENHNGEIHGVYGISQGATILSELLARNKIKVKYAVLDGVYVAHQGKLCAKIGIWAIRKIKNNGGNFLNSMMWAVKLMGMTKEDIEQEINRMALNYDDVSMERNFIENYTYRANSDLVNSDTKIYLWCGSKEPYAKKSHRILKQYIKNYEEEIFDNMGHSNLLLQHTEYIIKKLKEIYK